MLVTLAQLSQGGSRDRHRPPRPPRPSDPVDREELEALVEALIEEARQRARRRRRLYAASAALVALVVVAVSAVLQRSTQPDTSSSAFAARAGLPAGTTSSKLAFISHKSYDCCGRGGPFLLYVMNADGSGKRLLTRDASGGLAWSPDGRKIAFDGTTRDGKSEIYVINADGSGKRRLTRTAGQEIGPAWSPDGRKIAFGRGPNLHQQVYVMNADGSGQRRLTHLPAHNIAGPLTWLPDGKLTFVSFHGPNDFDVYLINADGSGQRNLTRAGGSTAPCRSGARTGRRSPSRASAMATGSSRDERRRERAAEPDAQRGERSPLFRSTLVADEEARLWTRPQRRRRQRRHLRHQRRRQRRAVPDTRAEPIWSPDGQKITFTSKRENWAEIYVMNADGSGQQRLTRSPARTFNARTVNDSPVWSPAPK